MKDLTISLWQFFRDYNTFCLPFGKLTKDLELVIKPKSVCYKDNQIDKVFINDWLEGLRERNDFDLAIPSGEWIGIDSDYINSILKEENLRIGYVLKTSYRYKEHKYSSDVEKLDQYKLINISKVILP